MLNGICTNKESVLENEMHDISFDFKIQTGRLNSNRKPDAKIIKKKKKKEGKKKRKKNENLR